MLILLKTPLETLNYFVDSMAEGHPEAIVLDITKPTFFAEAAALLPQLDDKSTVIMFNGAGRGFEYQDGRSVWQERKVRLYNILVDHPISYQAYLASAFFNENFVVVDRSHKLFINKYYPEIKQVYFMPHGGTRKTALIPYEKREIPVIYFGSCQAELTNFPAIPQLADNGQAFYNFIFHQMLNDYALEAEDAVQLYILQERISLSRKDELCLIESAHNSAERMNRRKHKLETIICLARNNIPVEIYGDHWEVAAEAFPDYINVHKRVTSDECVRLCGNAKIVLNFMPYFKDGSHERIPIAMLNKAICVTDRSRYLTEKYTHGRDIVFFDYHEPDVLCDNIKFLLSHAEEAVKIIENASTSAADASWSNRLDAILRHEFEK